MIIELDIKVVCDECGAVLDADYDEYSPPGGRSVCRTITVTPCKNCIEQAANKELVPA